MDGPGTRNWPGCGKKTRRCGANEILKKVAQLPRENGLNARRKRKFIPTTNSNHGLPVCENPLNREFQAAGAKWVSDITYLRTLGGWIYLTVAGPVRPENHWLGFQRRYGDGPHDPSRPADGLCLPHCSRGPGVPFRPGVAVLLKKFS
jgi:hypothetical protein